MTPILNRDFQHPADGWYMIEPVGEHPNQPAGVLQVIDPEAVRAIVASFNRQAQAPEFPGLLIDHEHFSHDQDKETRAFGWLTELQGRTDGIYGRIRWTDTGRQAVDGGDYRFFSTEYDPASAALLNSEPAKQAKDAKGELRRLRPLALAGLTLTNRPNNRGGKPITNRDDEAGGRRLETADSSLQPAASSLNRLADAAGAAAAPPNPTGRDTPLNHQRSMNRVTEKLGLAAEASADAILEAVTSILNRAAAADNARATAQASADALRAENQALREAQIETDLELHQHRFAPEQRATWKELLTLNRETALKALAALPERQAADTTRPVPKLVVNRAAAKTPADPASPPPGDPLKAAVEDYRIKNRCSFEEAWNAVRREKPELFKNEQG